MADNEILNLEEEVTLNPNDLNLKVKLFNTMARSLGQEFSTYWKVREKKTGLFATGRHGDYSYNYDNDHFSTQGKEWTKKDELYKYLKKGIEKKKSGLSERLKNSEIIEYQTLTLSKVTADIAEEMKSLELEILRMEKESNLKRIQELEEKEKELLKVVEKIEKTKN